MYATVQDLIDRWGEEALVELAPNRDGDDWLEGYNTTLVESALVDASGEIDGYLARRFSVPISPAPDLLIGLACDIARWRLSTAEHREDIRKRYEDAIARLQGIAEGKAGLGDDAAAGAGTDGPRIRKGRRRFDGAALRGW